MTHLFAILFFSVVLGMAVAALWSIFDENRSLILAHLPWKRRSNKPCNEPSSAEPVRAY